MVAWIALLANSLYLIYTLFLLVGYNLQPTGGVEHEFFPFQRGAYSCLFNQVVFILYLWYFVPFRHWRVETLR